MSLCRIVLVLAILVMPLVGHAKTRTDGNVPIAGLVPPIEFQMKDAETSKAVSAADFRGKVVMLYFGYTNCPDVCPDTLYKVHEVYTRLGMDAKKVVFLFVTVDPKRDTLPELKKYLALFDPHLIGLRGTPNQLYRLARRYRVVFSVRSSKNPEKYTVVHSALIYVFGPHGNARFVIPDLGLNQHPDFVAIADNLKRLLTGKPHHDFMAWIARFG